jgi:hypothetical protein
MLDIGDNTTCVSAARQVILRRARIQKWLDRFTPAEYNLHERNEAFTIDDLGNRDLVNGRDGNNVDYAIDNLTSRYDSVRGNTLRYDAGGNLIR